MPDDPDDIEVLTRYAAALADAVEAALPVWVERVVRERMDAAGRAPGDEDLDVVRDAGEKARVAVGGDVRALLTQDVDDQPTGPLDVVRRAVPYPTDVLRAARVPAVARDDVARRLHPHDIYDLSPASFADLGPEVQERGIEWGAAKAHVVLARRRKEGRR